MNKKTKKAIDDSIAHWKRMIAWAEKREPMMYKNPIDMVNSIDESWGTEHCDLCKLFYGNHTCFDCPLKLKGYRCENILSPWIKVAKSKNWGEWTKNAKEFLKILEGLKDETI